jgi:CRISPR-associated endonuclease/helicase Cas3
LDSFRGTFSSVTGGLRPYAYQEAVADLLWNRQNVILRAPTGAGKTLSVLIPFLHDRRRIGVRRMIYCLPLRTLANGIFEEARRVCQGTGMSVSLQTGEHRDDEFFQSDITVATYDQLLSGLLCGPYGLSSRQANMNAGAAVGALVVFDEFHLMELDRAFLTAACLMRFFGGVSRSVWMTATATEPLVKLLQKHLRAQEVALSADELTELSIGRGIRRSLRKVDEPLTAEAVLRFAGGRTLVVANQVKRAQELFETLSTHFDVVSLHSRFFPNDRAKKERLLAGVFGKGTTSQGALAITTQVVEAGLDLSCDNLLTELCPMNSLMQRAGRCARFAGQSGTVRVFRSAGARPYSEDECKRTWETLKDSDDLRPQDAGAWVNSVHGEGDAKASVGRLWPHMAKCRERITGLTQKQQVGGVAELIREGSDSVQVLIADTPDGLKPSAKETIGVYRQSLRPLIGTGAPVWSFDPEEATLWTPLTHANLSRAFVVCVPPELGGYSGDVGLRFGSDGREVSPSRTPAAQKKYGPLKVEGWVEHTAKVAENIGRLVVNDRFTDSMVAEGIAEGLEDLARTAALLHDLGKLQKQWQDWAAAWQSTVDLEYRQGQALAHTTYDSSNVEQRLKQAAIIPKRPPHAAASACYGFSLLSSLIRDATCAEKAAVLLAVVSHHGGWLSTDAGVLPLCESAHEALDRAGITTGRLSAQSATRVLEDLLKPALVNEFEDVWPVAAYLMRMLRLADRTATEETNNDG